MRAIAWTAAAAAFLVAAVALLLPAILPLLPQQEVSLDLSRDMKPEQLALFTNTTASVRFSFVRSASGDIAVRGAGRLLDWPVSFEAYIDYSIFGLSAEGEATARIEGSALAARAAFEGSAFGGWTARAKMEEAAFDGRDAVLASLLPRLADGALRGAAVSGRLSFDASAASTNGAHQAEWTASARLSDVAASLPLGESAVTLRGMRLRAGASGRGERVEIAPMFPRAESLEVANVALSNVFASVRATETAFLVTEAGADVCGGSARLYALFLDPAKLNAGFTLYLDEIDAGEALRLAAGFRGTATGRLHGKFPLRLKNGSEVSFGDAYLYSAPGETGNIRMEDASAFILPLASSGVTKDACDNLAKALRNLDYTALAICLRRGEDDEHALAVKLEGTATSGKKTVPVSFSATLRGDMERIANAGLRAAGAGPRNRNTKQGETK